MRGRRENIGNLNEDGGLGPAEGLLRWGGSDEEGGAGGGDGGDGVGGGGGGDVRSEKSNHNIFRPELCWPVTLAHSSVWTRTIKTCLQRDDLPSSSSSVLFSVLRSIRCF